MTGVTIHSLADVMETPSSPMSRLTIHPLPDVMESIEPVVATSSSPMSRVTIHPLPDVMESIEVVVAPCAMKEKDNSDGHAHVPDDDVARSAWARLRLWARADSPSKDVDPSLLFGMERTLYSAINVGMLVIVFGFGLMMVSNHDVQGFFVQGCIIVAAGIAFIGGSWVTHWCRMRTLSKGQKVTVRNSAVWTAFLVFLLLVVIGMELYHSHKYPYLRRSMPVDVNNPTISDLAVRSTTIEP